MSMTSRNCSGVSRVAGTAVPFPALLTSTSTCPNSFIAASTTARAFSGSAMSAATAIARRPACVTTARVASRRSTRRAASTRSAPASASALANATPRPEEAPVTIATLSSRRNRSSTVVISVLSFKGTRSGIGHNARSGLLPLLDGLARAVPHDARVVAVGVQLEHRRNDALDRLLAGGHAREVPQVLLGFADRLRIVGRADALVAGDDDPRLQGGDPVEAGDPVLASLLVGFGGHHLDLVVDDVAADDSMDSWRVQDRRVLGVALADADDLERPAIEFDDRVVIPVGG